MKQFGEEIRKPTDFFTGEVIPDAPRMAVVGTGRSTRGFLTLEDRGPQKPAGDSKPTVASNT